MPYFYDWYEYASGCGNTSGYSCGHAEISNVNCSAGGQCAKATIEICEEISTEKCEDNDGDGFYGLDPECINGQDCDDTPGSGHIIRPGQPENCSTAYDDNCDGLINCEDPSCHDSSCDSECDKDGDGYYSIDCGGPDCKDNPESEPNAANIYPGQDQENTEGLCGDGDNNDCDDEIDCVDVGCRSGPTNFCPQCTGTEICGPPETDDEDCDGISNCDDIDSCESDPWCVGGGGGGGGGDGSMFQQYCYNEYLVTLYFLCNSSGCTYLGYTVEYIGISCSVS
jgi:hypothetical protein